jgi:hypothetical protein
MRLTSFLLLPFFVIQAQGLSPLGTWKYVGFKYDGKCFPPTDPQREVVLQISQDGTTFLRWASKDEAGSCERRARYRVLTGDRLYQKIYWVNPRNNSSCGRDPDMQMGGESTTPFRRTTQAAVDYLLLDLELSGQPLTYVMQRWR